MLINKQYITQQLDYLNEEQMQQGYDTSGNKFPG